MICSVDINFLISWIGDFFVELTLLVVSGICLVIYAEKRRRKTQRLSEFASAVRSEIRSLNKKPDNLGGSFSITEWHLNSFLELTPFADNLKNLDKKRWEKIKGTWEEYRPPPN